MAEDRATARMAEDQLNEEKNGWCQRLLRCSLISKFSEWLHFPAFKPLDEMILCSTQISIQITQPNDKDASTVKLVLSDGSSTVLKMYLGDVTEGRSLTRVVLYMSFLHLYHTLQLQINYILITVRAMPTLGLTFLMTLNLQLAIEILNSTMFLIRNSINTVNNLQFVLAIISIMLSVVSYVSFVVVLACKFYSNYSVLTLAQIEQTYIVSFRWFVTYLVSILFSLVMNLMYASVYDISLMPVTSKVSLGYSNIQEYNITIITCSLIIPFITLVTYVFSMRSIKKADVFPPDTKKLLNNAKLPSLLRSEAASVDFESLYLNNQPYGLASGGELGELRLRGVLFTIFEKKTEKQRSTIDAIHGDFIGSPVPVDDDRQTWTLLIENIVVYRKGRYTIRNVFSMPQELDGESGYNIGAQYEEFAKGFPTLDEETLKARDKADRVNQSFRRMGSARSVPQEVLPELDYNVESRVEGIPTKKLDTNIDTRYKKLGLDVRVATIYCGQNDNGIDEAYKEIFNSLLNNKKNGEPDKNGSSCFGCCL